MFFTFYITWNARKNVYSIEQTEGKNESKVKDNWNKIRNCKLHLNVNDYRIKMVHTTYIFLRTLVSRFDMGTLSFSEDFV